MRCSKIGSTVKIGNLIYICIVRVIFVLFKANSVVYFLLVFVFGIVLNIFITTDVAVCCPYEYFFIFVNSLF